MYLSYFTDSFTAILESIDLENDSITIEEQLENNDVWKVPTDTAGSSNSNAKSRRTCWVSNDPSPNVEMSSGEVPKTPKKVNFQSVEEVIGQILTEVIITHIYI